MKILGVLYLALQLLSLPVHTAAAPIEMKIEPIVRDLIADLMSDSGFDIFGTPEIRLIGSFDDFQAVEIISRTLDTTKHIGGVDGGPIWTVRLSRQIAIYTTTHDAITSFIRLPESSRQEYLVRESGDGFDFLPGQFLAPTQKDLPSFKMSSSVQYDLLYNMVQSQARDRFELLEDADQKKPQKIFLSSGTNGEHLILNFDGFDYPILHSSQNNRKLRLELIRQGYDLFATGAIRRPLPLGGYDEIENHARESLAKFGINILKFVEVKFSIRPHLDGLSFRLKLPASASRSNELPLEKHLRRFVEQYKSPWADNSSINSIVVALECESDLKN